MSEHAAPPEAQEPYLIWDEMRRKWWGPRSIGYTAEVEQAGRYNVLYAVEMASKPNSYLHAVPLSDALRDGPPVEAPEVHAYCMSPDEWDAANAAVEAPAAPGSQSIGERQRRARHWLRAVADEVAYRQRQHRPFASAHEGLAIFEEEAEELQREVRHGTLSGIVEEAIQAAAMAVRILVDCGGEPPNGGGDDE